MLLVTLVVATLGPLSVVGHGNLMWPPSWFDPNGTIGLSPGGFMQGGLPEDVYSWPNSPIMWFTNHTFIPGEATLDPSLITVPDFHGDAYTTWEKANCLNPGGLSQVDYNICRDWYPVNPAKNPWMAPGSAPVFSPCGTAGGNPYGCGVWPGAKTGESGEMDSCLWGGYSFGVDALDIDWKDAVYTEWARGEKAKVGWGIRANHGGGYSYRLCKVGQDGPGGVTEECFQQTPLKFASENSWVQYGWDESRRVDFKAKRTTEGTFPPGSEWTMNPIPVCNSTDMGWMEPDCPEGFEFAPHGTGLHGTGESAWYEGPMFRWTLMDEVVVPEDLEPGEYVLSFRWDCEATPQIWNGCSNIVIF